MEKSRKKELSDTQVIPDPAVSKGLCDQVDPVSLPPVSTIPMVAVTPRIVNAKKAKPDVKPEVKDSKLVMISKPKKPNDEYIETTGKMKLGHNLKPEPETVIQVSPHETNENDDQGLVLFGIFLEQA